MRLIARYQHENEGLVSQVLRYQGRSKEYQHRTGHSQCFIKEDLTKLYAAKCIQVQSPMENNLKQPHHLFLGFYRSLCRPKKKLLSTALALT
jgi:hypothetical protein